MDTAQHHRFMHAFCVNPSTRFDQQQTDEQVILLLRAHPITQISWVFNCVLLLIVLGVANVFLGTVLNQSQRLFVLLFGIAFIFSYGLLNFLYWFFNVGLITNKRILDIDFSGVTYKEITETQLEKVEDITSKSSGYIGSLFNFGSIYIQTAGQETNVEFINIPDPSEAVRIINSVVP